MGRAPIIDDQAWRGKSFAFFSNTSCEFFPCHPVDAPEDFNCLFCFCPLYAYGMDCDGDCTWTEGGVKDCRNCLLPHGRDSYGIILQRLLELQASKSR